MHPGVSSTWIMLSSRILYSLQQVSNEVDDKFCQPCGSTVAGTCMCGGALTSLFRTLHLARFTTIVQDKTKRIYNSPYCAWTGNLLLVLDTSRLESHPRIVL